jgi:hypothetical protein
MRQLTAYLIQIMDKQQSIKMKSKLNSNTKKSLSKSASGMARGKCAMAMMSAVVAVSLAMLPVQPATASEEGAHENAATLFRALTANGWLVDDTYSTGLLARGQSVMIRTTFYAGNDYKIVAAGCEDARDVDIAVFDENWNLIAKDEDASPVAVANLRPKWTGTFHIRVTMYDSTRNGAHYVVQYAHKPVES